MPWYKELMSKINNLAEEFGLDDLSCDKFRDFVFERSREQYMAGNRAGIAFAHKQAGTSQS
ncbi:hypothetical protein ACFLZY_01515 [Patescibacteria group bacterium]